MSFFSAQINKINFATSELFVSFELEADSGVVHLEGENGTGKTSVLKAIAGIYTFSGSCTLDGENITTLPKNERAQMSYCPDKYQFSSEFTPLEYLNFVALAYGLTTLSKQQLSRLLTEYGIEESWLQKKIKTLSYGTVKKVLIAASLLAQPKLILMDEPVNGLDATGKNTLAEYIQRHSENSLFIIVCHDSNWMSQYSPQQTRLV